jgi:hypothetical protein
MNKFIRELLSSESAASAKRFITLIISLHFIISSFTILFISFYVIFYLPKGRLEPDLIIVLKQVLEYDMWIILAGLGFISAENIGQVMIAKAKAITGLGSSVTTGDVETMNVNGKPPSPKEEPKDI